MFRTFTDRPYDRRWRLVVQQGAVVAILCTIVTLVAAQTAANLRARGIASGFGYLGRAAGFEIAPGPVRFSSTDTYARALETGLVNSLRVAGLGIVAATCLGISVGVGRLSSRWVVATLSTLYVEVLRNVPLLLQLLCWYALLQRLPDSRAAWQPVPGMLLSNRGLVLFGGALTVSPEFAALLIALSTYTAAFIAENVRGGILAVARGQTEAATALGLSRIEVLRRIVLPQALPVIVPPTTSQFVSLAKNSSLAVAIGYPDLLSVTNTTLNQTGQAIEAIGIAMILYLAVSLAIALLSHRIFARRHVS